MYYIYYDVTGELAAEARAAYDPSVAEPDAVVPMVYPEQVVSATVDPATAPVLPVPIGVCRLLLSFAND